MPHLVIQHTPNIRTDFAALCRKLLETLLSIRDAEGQQVFPEGGTRVLEFPAAHYSVGDGKGDYAFMYLNLRIVAGRGQAVIKDTGDRLMSAIREHIAPVFERDPIGITLHIEETEKQLPGPVTLSYEGFHNNLRALFGR